MEREREREESRSHFLLRCVLLNADILMVDMTAGHEEALGFAEPAQFLSRLFTRTGSPEKVIYFST